MVHDQLKSGQVSEIRRRHRTSFGRPLAIMKTLVQRQGGVIETKLCQPLLGFARQFFRSPNPFQRRLRLRFACPDDPKLFAFKLAATRGTFRINRASAIFEIESGTRLRHPWTMFGEQWRAVAAFVTHIGEKNAVATQAALQTKCLGQFRHGLFKFNSHRAMVTAEHFGKNKSAPEPRTERF